MPRQLVDTNVLVRFFTGDPPEMADKTRKLVADADQGDVTLVVLPLIIAEIFFTLESYYTINRRDVAEKLLAFLQCRGLEIPERDQVFDALKRCRDKNAHFADAYLAATAAYHHYPVASFDRDFDKFNDVQRIEPRGK